MAVPMNRSTKSAPDSLSTSYLIGSAFIGISITTLKSSGRLRPGGTRSRLISFPRFQVCGSGNRTGCGRVARSDTRGTALCIGARILRELSEAKRRLAKVHRGFAALIGLFGKTRERQRRRRVHTQAQALEQVCARLAPELLAQAKQAQATQQRRVLRAELQPYRGALETFAHRQ